MKKIIVVLSFFLIFSNAYSNNFNTLLFSKKSISEITDTTYKCTLKTNSKNIYTDVYIFGLSDSSVKILKDNTSKEILIKEIRSIKFNRRGFWTGAAVGAGIAMGIGLLGGKGYTTGDGSRDYQIGTAFAFGILLTVPFALIGGGLGVLFAEDKFYNLSKLDFDAKRKKVKYLIKEYSDR